MDYPKFSFFTKKDDNNSLSGICNATSVFKNTRFDLDIIESYKLTGFYHAVVSPEVKSNFKYDYMLNKVQKIYYDQFNRAVKVEKLTDVLI